MPQSREGNRDPQQSENAQDGGDEPGVEPNGEGRRELDEHEEHPTQEHRYVNVDPRLQYRGGFHLTKTMGDLAAAGFAPSHG